LKNLKAIKKKRKDKYQRNILGTEEGGGQRSQIKIHAQSGLTGGKLEARQGCRNAQSTSLWIKDLLKNRGKGFWRGQKI